MIEVENLRKVYGDTVAVDGISFTVPEGEILGFLGPNGAGKSTTMRVLTGFTPPTSGSVRIAGFDAVSQSREISRILGYMPENAPVYGEMSVRAYVNFFAEAKGLRGAARKVAVDLALLECGLRDAQNRLLMNLSKGYRQRACLAQAVVGDPKVLILDEPTIGLDPKQIREVRALIRAMAGHRTVILSTHILPEVSLTCSNVIIIDRGRVVAGGAPENIRAESRDSNTVFLIVRGPRRAVIKTLERVEHVRRVICESHAPQREQAGALVASDMSDASDSSDGETKSKTTDDIEEENLSGRPPVHEYRVLVEKHYDLRTELARAILDAGFDLLEIRSAGLNLEDIFLQTVAGGE